MSDIDIPGYGKLWVANKPDLPLLGCLAASQ